MQLARSATANRGKGKKKKPAYNKYSVHIADMLGFITEVEGHIDGIL